MTARLTQLIARYLAVALAAMAGWLGASDTASASIGDLSSGLAAAIVAILLFAIDLVMHRVATGGILQPPAPRTPTTPPAPPASPISPPPSTAKGGKSGGSARLSILLLVLVAGLIAGFAGCAGMTPMQRVMNARQTYTDTLTALIPLRQAGLIDDAQALKIEAIRKQVAKGLDAAEAAAKSAPPDADAVGNVLDQVNALLDQLIEMQKAQETQETGKGLAKAAKSAEGEKSGNTDGAD